MNFAASLFPNPKPRKVVRRKCTHQDLQMYEAIVGRPAAEVATEPAKEATETPGIAPLQIVARRWRPAVIDFTVRLRNICEQGAQQVKPHVAEWWRQLSDQAVRRLDEAQARLNAARPANRRRVVAREVVPAAPIETSRPVMPVQPARAA